MQVPNLADNSLLIIAIQPASSVQTTAHETVYFDGIIWNSDIENLSIRIVVVKCTSSDNGVIDCFNVTHT